MHELCSSGGFVNAYAALELASTLKLEISVNDNNKKNKPVLVNPKDTKN